MLYIFRFLDIDESGALDFGEFEEAIMMSEQTAKDLTKREIVSDMDAALGAINMADIDGHREWVQQRMAEQLKKKISQVCV